MTNEPFLNQLYLDGKLQGFTRLHVAVTTHKQDSGGRRNLVTKFHLLPAHGLNKTVSSKAGAKQTETLGKTQQ